MSNRAGKQRGAVVKKEPAQLMKTIVMETIDYTIYDTERIPDHHEEVCLFVYPLGTCHPLCHHLKNEADTNMQMAGQLPAPQVFHANMLRCSLLGDNRSIADSDPMWNTVHLSLRIAEKQYFSGLAAELRSGKEVSIEIEQGQNFFVKANYLGPFAFRQISFFIRGKLHKPTI
jgi:hypothetical protein